MDSSHLDTLILIKNRTSNVIIIILLLILSSFFLIKFFFVFYFSSNTNAPHNSSRIFFPYQWQIQIKVIFARIVIKSSTIDICFKVESQFYVSVQYNSRSSFGSNVAWRLFEMCLLWLSIGWNRFNIVFKSQSHSLQTRLSTFIWNDWSLCELSTIE